ncbi:MAG: endonuclease/exonuclease/phosphatase family protein, partial [bacterium]
MSLSISLLCLIFLTGYADPAEFFPSESRRLFHSVSHHTRARPDSLKVVSYNIEYGEKIEQAVAELQTDPQLRDADILLLQELDPAGVMALAEALHCNYVYYPASISPHHGRQFGNAVLTSWPIVASQLVVLPHGMLVTGHRRVASVADIDLGDVVVRAVSVHTATIIMPLERRLAQVQAVADHLASWVGPPVIGGDFNSITQYEVFRIRRIFRRDDCRAVRLPPGETIKGWLPKLFN